MAPVNNLLDAYLKDKHTRQWAHKVNHFEIDPSAYVDIQKLSYQPLKDWIGAVVAPLDNCIIEWNPVSMLSASVAAGGAPPLKNYDPQASVDYIGVIVYNNKLFFTTYGGCGDETCKIKHKLILPYVLHLNLPRDNSQTQLMYEETVYGIRYKEIMKDIPSFLINNIWENEFDKFSDEETKESLQLLKCPEILYEFAGDVRVALAILAYMNADRDQEQIFTQKKKSTFLGGKVYPYPKTNLVVIRPGSTQRIYERNERHDPLNNRRLHEVRRHVRKLKTGKFVIVRPHKRGNAELGEVTKRYIVEKDPN
jgi:hypothetical protein